MKKDKYPDNGLKPISIQSKSDTASVDQQQLVEIDKFVVDKFGSQSGLAVFYLDYGVRFARWENKQLDFYYPDDKKQLANYLQLARIFNEERELKIWKDNDKFIYRLRVDEPGEDYWAIEAEQALWGTHTDSLGNGWTRLWEDRGTELIVPFDISIPEGQAAPRTRACVRTRNYIDYLSNGQASYGDCRFVELKEKNKE